MPSTIEGSAIAPKIHLLHAGSPVGRRNADRFGYRPTYCNPSGVNIAYFTRDPMRVTCKRCIRSFARERGEAAEWSHDA